MANYYDLDTEGVRMFAAVLLLQLERLTGSTDADLRPAHFDAVRRLYGLDPAYSCGQPADLASHEPQTR